jgi:hypothetical protein
MANNSEGGQGSQRAVVPVMMMTHNEMLAKDKEFEIIAIPDVTLQL